MINEEAQKDRIHIPGNGRTNRVLLRLLYLKSEQPLFQPLLTDGVI